MASQAEDASSSVFQAMLQLQGDVLKAALDHFLPPSPKAQSEGSDLQQWARVAGKLQTMMLDFQAERLTSAAETPRVSPFALWSDMLEDWRQRLPMGEPAANARLWEDGLQLWQTVLGQMGIGSAAGEETTPQRLPREDRRFADPKWREHPVFALIHQTYLLAAEEIMEIADKASGLDPAKRQQLRFASRAVVDALSPANFPLTNPLVIERTLETKGENLVKGLRHLLTDARKGQLTHTDPDAFELGRNIALTPGKVVHETPMYQLIQYSPTTPTVLATPVVIFPPWINRYYILDLNPQKSMVAWAVEQGLTVFMVSWKSADASMRDVVSDDYALAELDAIDHIRERLEIPAVHAVGYCVAGTTLAALLAVLARKGEADKVRSATLFTAQVDFEKSGDLKLLVDDRKIAAMERLATDGYLDGRYMSATFNMLRSPDLIWQYVINNYLMGEDYPAFDMLHWNGDTSNLPWTWLKNYLIELYRDNRLIEPDSLSIDGTPIDLNRIETPAYIQAGKEDHIAPPESVWRVTRHLKGPRKFVLAGSGHIAGVVNPPAAGKYQYWTNPAPCATLDEFMAGASETPGSWWPDWLGWLKGIESGTVPATGRRAPGGAGDPVIEDAPGRYVTNR